MPSESLAHRVWFRRDPLVVPRADLVDVARGRPAVDAEGRDPSTPDTNLEDFGDHPPTLCVHEVHFVSSVHARVPWAPVDVGSHWLHDFGLEDGGKKNP